MDSRAVNISRLLYAANKHTSLDELSVGVPHTLIGKIVIHERDKTIPPAAAHCYL